MVFRACAVSLLLLTVPVAGHAEQGAPGASARSQAQPGSRLNQLFTQLKAAKDEAEARSLSAEIERIWARSGSDTADLLLQRVTAALAAGDQDIALDLLDSILTLRPGWTEARNRRASLNFMRNDLDAAMRDLAVVLRDEPRQFAAWTGLGTIMLKIDNKRRALDAFQHALAINPQLDSAKQAVEKLRKDLDGTPI
jgi:tetratricopeptide (TPR) repeat protein